MDGNQELFRILDANLNRASEGLRVVEDRARFIHENADMAKEIRSLRHEVRKTPAHFMTRFMAGRDVGRDPGLVVSQTHPIDRKQCAADIVNGNFKRVQEALRVIEETFNLAGFYEMSKAYESLRFWAYALEKRYHQVLTPGLRRNVFDTDIYCITAEKFSRGRDNVTVVAEMIQAGIKVIQYREKEKKAGAKWIECLKIREMTAKAGVCLIVNDDVDLALMVGADGVHVGQDDFPILAVRRLVGEEMIIGLSTHSPEQAREAYQNGADYMGVGPIFKTYTKADVCDPVGFSYLDYAVQEAQLPFVAIGGIKTDNVAAITERGATCVALVTEIVGAEDIGATIRQIRTNMKPIRKDKNELHHSERCRPQRDCHSPNGDCGP